MSTYPRGKRNMNNWEKLVILVPLTVALGSCAATSFRTVTPFDSESAKKLLEDGPNTIKGSAVVRQERGEVVSCAGHTVYLVPATAYADERMRIVYGRLDHGFSNNRQTFQNEPLGYKELVRETHCDARGYFAFRSVADGTFYVASQITWSAGNYSTKRGSLMKRVTVSNGDTKQIVLAP